MYRTLFVLLFLTTSQLHALAIRHEAMAKKVGKYESEGFFVGGTKESTVVKLKDIRRAKSNEGFERVVLDLEPLNGNSAIPYFYVQNAQSESRIVLSIWADVQYDFDVDKIQKAFARSAVIKKLNIVPRVENGLMILEFNMNSEKAKIEAFILSNPNRIILDIL